MIDITEAALNKIKESLKDNKYFLIGVKSSGCAGFEYVFEYKNDFDSDKEFKFNEYILINRKSVKILGDAVLDYRKSLMQSGFVFNNPNVKSECGCKKSFSL